MKKSIGTLALNLFVLLSISCAGKEMVMTSGMTISATNLNGTIAIKAGEGLKRSYYWDNKHLTIKLWPRIERWHGSLGAYSPGGGIYVHAVVEEGQQHFCSEKEALEWLSWRGKASTYVYTSEGLVVGYRSAKLSTQNSYSLHVDVWQIFIDGQMPKQLPGEETNRIIVTYENNASKERPPVGKFIPNKPKIINNRLYSGKSVDLMEEKRTPSAAIEKVIKFGKLISSKNNFVYFGTGEKFDPFKDVTWVEIDKEGRVVLFGF